MRVSNLIARTLAIVFLGGWIVVSAPQAPTVRAVDEKVLREYAGVYRWEPNVFVYLQMWDEFSGFGKPQLVAFDESGEVRTLYPTATTSSSRGMAPRFRRRSNPASSFSATAPTKLNR